MNLQAWLGEKPQQTFIEEQYYRQPYSGHCASAESVAPGAWPTLAGIFDQPSADVMVVRRNQRYEGSPPDSLAQAQALVEQGYTLLVRHAEHHDERLAQLAANFARDFAAPVNIHLYVTPGDDFGFSWHYDAEEVFILQTTGTKTYSLRKNTVNPWPIEETLPQNMRYEREIMPLMHCALAAGDWLYIPSGWWHKGRALPGDPAISLALGVMARTGVDLFDLLRREVLNSLLWRQRLPVLGDASPLNEAQQRAALASMLETLAKDVAQLLQSERLLDAALGLHHQAGDRLP